MEVASEKRRDQVVHEWNRSKGATYEEKARTEEAEEEMAEEETYFWFSCGKVCLDKDLANSNVLAHITHSLFHGLSCS